MNHYQSILIEKDYYTSLKDNLDFQERKWGNGNKLKRLVCSYNILEIQLIPALKEVVELAELYLDRKVYSVWCNYYRDGYDFTPYHKDSYNCDVAMLSFGSTRDLYFKHDTTGEVEKFKMGNGDIFTFTPEINKNYKHSIPERRRHKDGRISLVLFLM